MALPRSEFWDHVHTNQLLRSLSARSDETMRPDLYLLR